MALGVLQHRAQDSAGNLIAADLRVRRETAALPLVTLYSDRDGDNQISNPTVGGFFSDGKIRAYVASGNYRVDLLVDGEVVDTLYNVPVIDIPPTVREVLDAARTYYVRADGSDSNDGLTNNSGGAFLTIQKAINVAAALDLSIYDVTIQLAAGTYSTSTGNVLATLVGSGSVTIIGDETTPANVVVTTSGAMTSSHGNFLANAIRGTYKLRGMKLTSTASGTRYAIQVQNGAYVEFQNIDFGTGFTQHLRAAGGFLSATGNYSITGGATGHVEANGIGVLRTQGVTVTLTGTPAFTTFATATRLGIFFATNVTYSGSATGVRYSVTENGVIVVNGAGATYFPGDATGATATGGQYN